MVEALKGERDRGHLEIIDEARTIDEPYWFQHPIWYKDKPTEAG